MNQLVALPQNTTRMKISTLLVVALLAFTALADAAKNEVRNERANRGPQGPQVKFMPLDSYDNYSEDRYNDKKLGPGMLPIDRRGSEDCKKICKDKSFTKLEEYMKKYAQCEKKAQKTEDKKGLENQAFLAIWKCLQKLDEETDKEGEKWKKCAKKCEDNKDPDIGM